MESKNTVSMACGALRRGFTIIELMVVISIIGILATLITRAALSSIKEGREQDAKVMAQAINMGISNYHALMGEWPGPIEKFARDGKPPTGNAEFPGALKAEDADDVVYEIIKESGKDNPMIDVSGLFVASKTAARAKHGHGLKYGEARRQNVAPGNMAFGYQRRENGEFRRFLISYDPTNDTVHVETESAFNNRRWNVGNR